MIVKDAELRARMRQLTVDDLRGIVRNDSAKYTAHAVAVAQQELKSRPPIDFGDEDVSRQFGSRARVPDHSLRSRVPAGLWFAFCAFTCLALIATVMLLIVFGVFLTDIITTRELAAALMWYVMVTGVSIWTAAAIRAERSHARPLLLLLIAGGAINNVVQVFRTPELAEPDTVGFVVLAGAFWYFAFSPSVTRYYRELAGNRAKR